MAHLAGDPLTRSAEPDAVRRELARLIDSPAFKDSDRLVRFLTFVVEETLQGRGARLKESVVGIEVFDRSPDYDPKEDPIVRVQARRLRAKLDAHYTTLGRPGDLRIELPKGGYAPQFSFAPAPDPPAAEVIEPSPPAPEHHRQRWRIAAIVLALTLAAAGAWAFFSNRKAPGRTAGSRLFTAYPGYQHTPAFSPDGQMLAFSWDGTDAGKPSIYVQRLDADTPKRLTASDSRDWRPAWLPDGQSVGFVREDGTNRFAVMVVPLLGAGERRVAALSGPAAPRIQFSKDGSKLYTSEPVPDGRQRIVELDLASGNRRDLTKADGVGPGAPGDDEPALSPDGNSIAFRRRTGSAVGDIFTVPAKGGEIRRVTHDQSGTVGFSWTRDGRSLIVSSRRSSSLQRLWRYAVDGRNEPVCLTDAALAASFPSVSLRDGTIAFASRYLDSNVWRIDLTGARPPERIIASNLLDSTPRYAPDLSRIAFRSTRTGNDELWITDANGGSPSRITNFGGPVTGSAAWSPDGHSLVFDSRPNGNADVFVVPAGGGAPRQLTREPSNEVIPSFSRDGQYVYFASDRNGAWQVWKQPIAGGEAKQVTQDGGFRAMESQDGRWLYYFKIATGGLYRLPSDGGTPAAVLPSYPSSFWGRWSLIGGKVLYFALRESDKGADPTELRLFDPSNGKDSAVATTPFPAVRWDGAIDASPDGRFALVSLLEREGSEIHLLPEN